ncbi:UNVERIFIED_CONTAM: hypothetical protein Scaly_2754800 [Sesamum calycinum]|uniref:Retrotransposon gag protein n=1 Tax=Sesamum calycinum TaxID=2727403 RepID=A0AAW2J020_9LAMI
MSKKLKQSSQMPPLAEYVDKNLHSPSYASESDAKKSPSSSPCSMSSYSYTINVAQVLVTNATTKEEELESLTRAIEGLMKHVQEQDAQIAWLINKAKTVDASLIMGKQVEAHDEVEPPAKQHYDEKDISNIEGSSKSSFTYSKPYTPRIDSLKIPMGYLPPKFQQFDVKQFVRSLKGNAFDWYTDLEAFKFSPMERRRPQRKLTLKEIQGREYPFLDFDVPGIFDDLFEANLIDLPEMKRPEEAEQKDDLKYCKYHWLVGHAIQDCFIFKNKVMQLARQGKISLEEDSTVTNAITIESKHVDGNKDSCNAMHGDNITSNEDTLFEKGGFL